MPSNFFSRAFYRGTAAERVAFSPTIIGATWFDTTLNMLYVWNGAAWVSSAGGTVAPANAQYVTMALDATLTDERVLAAGPDMVLTDGGAGGNATIGRAGNKILLRKASGVVLTEYPATNAGFDAANAAGVAGDTIELPVGSILTGVRAVTAGIAVVGQGWLTITDCTFTDGTVLERLRNEGRYYVYGGKNSGFVTGLTSDATRCYGFNMAPAASNTLVVGGRMTQVQRSTIPGDVWYDYIQFEAPTIIVSGQYAGTPKIYFAVGGVNKFRTGLVGAGNDYELAGQVAGDYTFLYTHAGIISSKIAGAAGIALNPNAATGNFTGSITLPGSLSNDRTYTLPDASGIFALVPAGGLVSGTGTTGQLTKWTNGAGGVIGDAAIIPPAANILTITNAAAATLALAIGAGKTLTLTAADNYNLTVPATGTAALLNQSNSFTLINPLVTIAESWIGPSATAGVYFKAGNVGIGTIAPGAGYATAYGKILDVVGTSGYTGIGVHCTDNSKGAYFDQLNDNSKELFFGTYGSAVVGVAYFAQAAANNSFIVAYPNNVLALGTYGAAALYLGTNNLTRMTISSAGFVGVGITPTAKFHVGSAAGGANSGLNLTQIAENGFAGSSYVPIDFSVPTSGLIGQFLATANNYSSGSLDLVANSLALITESAAGQLWLGACGASGYVSISAGGYGVANEAIRITSTDLVGIGTITPGTKLHVVQSTTTTNAVLETQRIEARVSTGATGGAAGFGPGLTFYGESATDGNYRQMGQIAATWTTATDATRKAKISFSAYDTAARLGFEIEASGAAPMISFYGGTTVVRGAALTAQLTTLTFTAPGTPDYAIQDFAQNGGAGIWGFADHDEANSVLKVIANLQTRVAELEARLGSATGVNLFA